VIRNALHRPVVNVCLGFRIIKRVWREDDYLFVCLSVCLSICKVIIYGYNSSTSTAQQLANYLIVLGKSTIYKTYMAANAGHGPPPNYYRLVQLRLRYRMLLELYKSIANNNLDSFKSYWLHKQALANMQNEKLTMTINL
jgi:hypothetical protein